MNVLFMWQNKDSDRLMPVLTPEWLDLSHLTDHTCHHLIIPFHYPRSRLHTATFMHFTKCGQVTSMSEALGVTDTLML